MKTTLLPALSSLWQLLTLLLLLCAWPGAGTAQAATPGTVVAWGSGAGTAVPVAAQRGVVAIAAGSGHTVALLGSVPLLPILKARPSENELILSWSKNGVGFALQSTLNLTPPVISIDSTNPPAVIGAQFTVTNTLSAPVQFYRLRKL